MNEAVIALSKLMFQRHPSYEILNRHRKWDGDLIDLLHEAFIEATDELTTEKSIELKMKFIDRKRELYIRYSKPEPEMEPERETQLDNREGEIVW